MKNKIKPEAIDSFASRSTAALVTMFKKIGEAFQNIPDSKFESEGDLDLCASPLVLDPEEKWIAVAGVLDTNYKIIVADAVDESERSVAFAIRHRRQAIIIENACHLLRQAAKKNSEMNANPLEYINAILADYERQVETGRLRIDDHEGYDIAVKSIRGFLDDFRDAYYRITCDELIE